MALSKATKYALANASLVAVVCCVYRYYVTAMSQPRDGSKTTQLILAGILLYGAIAVVTVVRMYLRQGRNDVVGQSQKGSEVDALGALGTDRLKNITTQLVISDEEFDSLQNKGELVLSPERFNLPLRIKDSVQITTNKQAYNRTLDTTVTQIDGVNQRVVIVPAKQ